MPIIIKEIEDTKGVYDQLEAQRRYKGITQVELAQSLGISARTYQNWINNGTTEKNIKRIQESIKNHPLTKDSKP